MIRFIVPAYNEGKNLTSVVSDIARVLPVASYEIAIVNDGSSDDTLVVARSLAEKFPVIVLNHTINRGVAAAFRTGLEFTVRKSKPDDIIIIMEGDGTSSTDLLPALINRIVGGADVVIASRYQPGGRYYRFPLKRRVLSLGANIVFQLLFPIPGVKDYSIFYRAYRARGLQLAMAHFGSQFITVSTFFVNIEILFKLQTFVKRIEEIPFVYDYGKKRGKSGMKIMKNLRSYISFIFYNVLRLSK